MADVLRQNQERIARAIASELGEDPLTEDSLEQVDMKNIYQAGQTAAFETAKKTLDEVLASCKGLLSNGAPADEVRQLILEMVQTVGVNHRYTKLDDNYAVTRRNNGEAANRIMQCLQDGETVEQVLKCVYADVYYMMNPDEAQGSADNGDDADSSEAAAGDTDFMKQLKSYLSYLAGEFSSRVEEITVDGETVLAPNPEYVRLRQARSNGVWLLSYDSIFGEARNPWRGSDPDKYQAQFDVPVRDQDLAAAANPDDTDTIRQLIFESVPRHQAHDDESGKPKNYFLMTREDNEGLKVDIADLLGLPHNSSLLGWLRSELIKGADAGALSQLYAEQQREWAEQESRPKEDLLKLRPTRSVAETVPEPAPLPTKNDAADRDRTIRSVKAFIRSEIDGLSREDAMARKATILTKAKTLL